MGRNQGRGMMVQKQAAGFKFGKYRTEVLEELGEVKFRQNTYRLVRVRVHGGQEYFSLRLYNRQGKFIKQMLMEPGARPRIAWLLGGSSERG